MNRDFFIPIMAASLGALAAGALRTVLDWLDRSRNRRSILKAFAGEVGILCWIIRHHYHPERWRYVADRIERGEGVRLVLDLSNNYFIMHENLSGDIGNLGREQAATVTEFYTLCKIAIDTVGVQSVYSGVPQNIRFAARMIELALELGDQILVMPKGMRPPSRLGEPCDWPSVRAEATRAWAATAKVDCGADSAETSRCQQS